MDAPVVPVVACAWADAVSITAEEVNEGEVILPCQDKVWTPPLPPPPESKPKAKKGKGKGKKKY